MKAAVMVLFSALLLLPPLPALSEAITLVTLGDSLTAGDGDDGVGGGYPSRLVNLLQTPYPGSTLNNLGTSGDTAYDLINKQLNQAVSLLNAAPSANRKVALVWIGSNDLFGLYNSTVCDEYYESIESCELIELGLYSDNIGQILSSLRATGANVYIALLDDQTKRPVMTDPELRMSQMEFITDDDVDRMKNQIPQYNSAIQIHANSNGAESVDFFDTSIFEDEATLSDDGNHPNGAGYDAITGIWFDAVTGVTPPVADVRPQIQANGTNDAVAVSAGTPLVISILLDTGIFVGADADWWVGYFVNGVWHTYVYPTGWSEGINPAYRGPLFNLSSFDVLDDELPVGDYTFYFAVDTTPDGGLTGSTMWYDFVGVLVE